MSEQKTVTTHRQYHEKDFTGQNLENLVCAIEGAIGGYSAGATPLGKKIIRMCEDAIEEDQRKKPSEEKHVAA